MPARSIRDNRDDEEDNGDRRRDPSTRSASQLSALSPGTRSSGLHLAIRGLVQVAVQLASNASRSSRAPSRANSDADSYSDSASTISGTPVSPRRNDAPSPNHLAAACASLGIGDRETYVRALSGGSLSRAPSIVGDSDLLPDGDEYNASGSQYSEYCARHPLPSQLDPLLEDEDEDEVPALDPDNGTTDEDAGHTAIEGNGIGRGGGGSLGGGGSAGGGVGVVGHGGVGRGNGVATTPGRSRGRRRHFDWYAVTRGSRVGVSNQWSEVVDWVAGVSCNAYKGYSTEAEAVRAYNAAYARGEVAVVDNTVPPLAPTENVPVLTTAHPSRLQPARQLPASGRSYASTSRQPPLTAPTRASSSRVPVNYQSSSGTQSQHSTRRTSASNSYGRMSTSTSTPSATLTNSTSTGSHGTPALDEFAEFDDDPTFEAAAMEAMDRYDADYAARDNKGKGRDPDR